MTEIAVHSGSVTDLAQPWWRTAVVYQVYIRSFADGNGDGIGDLAGLRSKLGYLAELGVDAIWINPWYPSPMVDAGYDVADFRDIEPDYGTLAEAEALIEEAHAVGIRVIIDIVPNHTSHLHAWFQAALRDEPGARDRYIFREGRGARGELPPNDWTSNFGGPAWTRLADVGASGATGEVPGASGATGEVPGASGATGEVPGASGATGDRHWWYLHLFAPEQPDLNWENPEVRADFEDVLRFWFDRGVDGFRIDVAHGLAKDPAMPDAGERDGAHHLGAHPAYDQDAVHEVYRGWRAVANGYADKVFVAEAWVPDNERLSRYLRPDELHTAFQFDFLRAPWRAEVIRAVIDDALAQAAHVGAPATWVLSNHDVPRVATRYARSQPAHPIESEWDRARWAAEEPDLELGRRRARAAALLQLALPGTAYVYQGEELGLEEFEDLPHDARQDPTWVQSQFTDVGRDGCRIPLPFAGDIPPYGFSVNPAARPWLPQPAGWGALTVAAQEADPTSTLALYRGALRLRRGLFDGDQPMTWLDDRDGVLAFRRGDVECWVNTGSNEVVLPVGEQLLGSDPSVAGGILPPDASVWVRRG